MRFAKLAAKIPARRMPEALERLMKGRTSIVIAHHLATILRANIIFVVKDSQLKERGTHNELIAAGGFYSRRGSQKGSGAGRDGARQHLTCEQRDRSAAEKIFNGL